MSPHNRYRSAPPPPPVQGGGGNSLVSTLGPLALKYGVNAAIPGGGFAADAALAAGSTLFEEGGAVREKGTNRGGATADALRALWGYAMKNNNLQEGKGRWAGMKKHGYKPVNKANGGMIGGSYNPAQDPTRKIGDAIAAQGGVSMLAKGGSVGCGPLAEVSYKSEGGEIWSRKYHDPNKAKPSGDSKKEG